LVLLPDISVNEIVGFGNASTLIEAKTETEHPLAELLTVTVYDAAEEGETTLLLPLALIGAAHEYVIPVVGLAVRVTEVPLHIMPSLLAIPELSVKEIAGLGNELTVTLVDVEAEQAVAELVTVTS
jgi:hypothetical protein